MQIASRTCLGPVGEFNSQAFGNERGISPVDFAAGIPSKTATTERPSDTLPAGHMQCGGEVVKIAAGGWPLRASGGIGRRAGLRILCRKACGFDSRLAQFVSAKAVRSYALRLAADRQGPRYTLWPSSVTTAWLVGLCLRYDGILSLRGSSAMRSSLPSDGNPPAGYRISAWVWGCTSARWKVRKSFFWGRVLRSLGATGHG
jgi:hypothetical protein